MGLSTARLRLAVALCAALPAAPSQAASQLLLPYPTRLGDIPAATYDDAGRRVGPAKMSVLYSPVGKVRMSVEAGVDGGARSRAVAELAVVEPEKSLRLLAEEFRAVDEEGRSLGVLRIDHDKGEATCTPPGGSGDDAVRVALPPEDRVANVPLDLLFLPLVNREAEQIDFQVFVCRGGPRFVDFAATVARRADYGTPHRVVEIRPRPEIGAVFSLFARAVSPHLAFWYDGNGTGSYLGHRMPLYSRGPEVVVIRDDVAPDLLLASR